MKNPDSRLVRDFHEILRNKANGYYFQVDQTYSCGGTLFTFAIRQQAPIEILQYLIDRNANINRRESGGAAPLHVAIVSNNFDIVNFLIDHRADVYMELSFDTPISLAIKKSSPQILKLLINAGAAVESDDLSLALQMNKIEILDLLLKTKFAVEPFLLNKSIEKNMSLEALGKIIDANPGLTNLMNGLNPLSLAIKNGKLDIVKLLLQKGVDVNQLNEDGNSPIAIAVQENQLEIIKLMIKNGANVCKFDKNGKPPLAWAVKNTNLEIIELLFQNGAIFVIDLVFLEAIQTNTVEIVEMFIDNGAIPNGNSSIYKETSPIEQAILIKSVDILKLLLEHGADIIKDLTVEKTLKYFCGFLEKNDLEMINFFTGTLSLPKFDCSNKSLALAIKLKNVDLVKLLLKKLDKWNVHLEIEESEVNGFTPLMIAVFLQNIDLVKIILEKNVDVNATNDEEDSALSMAASLRNFKIFQLLIENGAAPKNEDLGKSPNLARFYKLVKRNLKTNIDQAESALPEQSI